MVESLILYSAQQLAQLAAMLTVVNSFPSRQSRDLNYVIFFRSKLSIPLLWHISRRIQCLYYLFKIIVLTCLELLFLAHLNWITPLEILYILKKSSTS